MHISLNVASDKYPNGFLLGSDSVLYIDGRWNANSRSLAVENKVAEIRKWRNDPTVRAVSYHVLGKGDYREHPISRLVGAW